MCFPWYVRLVRLVGTVGTVGSYRTKRTNRTATSVPNVPPNRTDEPCQVKGGQGGSFFRYGKTPPPYPPPEPGTVHRYSCVVLFFACLVRPFGTLGQLYQPYHTKRTKRTSRTVPSAPTVPSVPYQAHQPYQAYHTWFLGGYQSSTYLGPINIYKYRRCFFIISIWSI